MNLRTHHIDAQAPPPARPGPISPGRASQTDPFAQGLPRAVVLLLLDPKADRRSDAWRTAYRQYLTTQHWETKKAETYAVYGHACTVCDSPLGLQVHHRPEGYRNLFREVANRHLNILCSRCHRRHHGKG